ncbi:MAG TPA: SGNH/GDSL hydrolase family protein [Elusimicrobiota bacterium]|nr:SGNH/GDSL hydrolase family protein [Elusimicrobiota bacterium]
MNRFQRILIISHDTLHRAYWTVYSILFQKPLLYAIGDSHVLTFKRCPRFIVYHLGPATAHNLGKPGNTTRSRERLFDLLRRLNRRNGLIMLMFGEIDCRIHFYNQYMKHEKKHPLSQFIDDTISKYMGVLGEVQQLGIDFFVCGIPPAGRQGNAYGYIHYADPQTRSLIYREFNEKLEHACAGRGIRYLNIYSKTAGPDGFTRAEYLSDDDVHLKQNTHRFISEWIEKTRPIDI